MPPPSHPSKARLVSLLMNARRLDVEAHRSRRAGVVPAAPVLIVLLETGKYIEPRTVGLRPRQVPIEVTRPGIPAAAAAQRAAAGDMERCWPARYAAIERDRGGIARLRLEKRCITVVFDRAGHLPRTKRRSPSMSSRT